MDALYKERSAMITLKRLFHKNVMFRQGRMDLDINSQAFTYLESSHKVSHRINTTEKHALEKSIIPLHSSHDQRYRHFR